MRRLMIDMNECPFDIWQYFNLVLQLLTDVVSFPQWRIGVHDDVNFDVIFLKLEIKNNFYSALPITYRTTLRRTDQ